MALRLRRGTDAERLLITPVEGELIYTTDTKLLYVGDGSTAGGTLVTGAGGGSGTLDGLTDTDVAGATDNQVLTWIAGTSKWQPTTIPGVGALSLDDLSDVDVGGVNVGDVLRFDGVNFTHTNVENLVTTLEGNLKINVVANDSTIMVNGDDGTLTGDLTGNVLGNVVGNVTGNVTGNVNAADGTNVLYSGTDGTDAAFAGEVTGNVIGNVTGNVIGNVTGNVTGDLQGSVFGDDSSLIIDGISGTVKGPVESNTVQAGNIKLTSVTSDNVLYLRSNVDGNFFTITTEDSAGTVLITSNAQVGAPTDSVERTFKLYNSNPSAAAVALSQIHNTDAGPGGSIGIFRSRGSKTVPTTVQTGDVIGNFVTAGFNGAAYRGAGGVRTVVTGTPEALRIPTNVEIFTAKADGSNEVKLTVKNTGETVFTGAATLVNYADTTARDAAITSPTNGMMIYLTSTHKAQVYANTGWVDLH